MVLIWRGKGLLGALGVVFVLVTAVALAKVQPSWLCLVGMFASLLISGVVCIHYGTKWNRPVVWHRLSFIPLQAWGWIYLILAALQLLSALVGTVSNGIDEPGRMFLALSQSVGLGLLVGLAFLLARSTSRSRQAAKPVLQGDASFRFNAE